MSMHLIDVEASTAGTRYTALATKSGPAVPRIAYPMNASDTIDNACARVRQMVCDGAPAREILTSLVTAAEIASSPRAVASILVLDEHGLLRNGASPNLPRDYLSKRLAQTN